LAKPQTVQAVEFNKLKPKTVNQSKFLKAVTNNDVVICDGPAGTGKTLLSIGIACEWLLAGKMESILIARTLIGCGDIGTFPGTEFEKAEPYFYAHLAYFKKILGTDYRKYMQNEKIILKPLEMLRGHTYDKTIMILDESQNADGKQIKMFLSRMGHYSKAIIVGDVTQSDFDPAGFRFCTSFLEGLENCEVIKFDYTDILRNTRIGHILKVFDDNGYR
jgi:phosphate starvation-inducible PhoH-like protein